MNRASEDIPVDLFRQIQQWSENGEVTADNGLVSISALLSTIACPVLHIDNRGLEAGECIQEYSSIVVDELERKLDFLMSECCDERVFTPMIRWIVARRRHAWRAVS